MIGKTIPILCALISMVSASCVSFTQSYPEVFAVPLSGCAPSCLPPPPITENIIIRPACASSLVRPRAIAPRPVVSSPCVSAPASIISSSIITAPPQVVSPCTTVQTISNSVTPSITLLSGAGFGGTVLPGPAGLSSGLVSSVLPITNGPEPSPIEVVQAPPVTLPAVEGPLITLSNPPVPAPKVLSQRCICTKTVIKPRVIQREVTIPKVERYLKRTVTQNIENVAYKSTPIGAGPSAAVAAPVVAAVGGECGSSVVSTSPTVLVPAKTSCSSTCV